ncbi:MAG: hypothetical protein ACREUU_07450, partial [Gammaproteobacteria bacterium]
PRVARSSQPWALCRNPFRIPDFPDAPIDALRLGRYSFTMNAFEFTTELSGGAVLTMPRAIAAQLPKAGRARVIVLTDYDADDAEWRAGAYEQFLREDPPEDAVYDNPR